MSSRKTKQVDEYLIEWETLAHGSAGPQLQLQLAEAVPSRKAPAKTVRPQWEAKSDLIVEFGSNMPRSRLH